MLSQTIVFYYHILPCVNLAQTQILSGTRYGPSEAGPGVKPVAARGPGVKPVAARPPPLYISRTLQSPTHFMPSDTTKKVLACPLSTYAAKLCHYSTGSAGNFLFVIHIIISV